MIINARGAALELKNNNEVLLQRYQELEQAKKEIQEHYKELDLAHFELRQAHELSSQQARQLRTAQRINEIIQRELDLQRALEAIASACVEIGGFGSAKIRVQAVAALVEDPETTKETGQTLREQGVVETLRERSMEIDESIPPLNSPIFVRNRTVGSLELKLKSLADKKDGQTILTHILPAISSAVGNALAYKELEEHSDTLEQHVAERTASLRTTHHELVRKVAELKMAQAARQQFVASINHEIRTPIAIINLALADLERQGVFTAGAQESALDIRDNLQRLIYLIDNLLLAADAQNNELQFRLHKTPVDVAGKSQQVLRYWKRRAQLEGLLLTYQGPAQLMATVDLRAFETLLSNLVINAIKYTPRDGTITVLLTQGAEELELAVQDTGIGLNEEEQQRIFDRFAQGESKPLRTIGHGTGTGLGLSIVKSIVELHHGSCSVSSQPGQGTTFWVKIPYAQVTGLAPAAGDRLSQPTEAEAQLLAAEQAGLGFADMDSSRFHELEGHALQSQQGLVPCEGEPEGIVLIAEDDHALIYYMTQFLKDRYQLLLAPDGVKALELARQHKPDMLITDINMPEMDGIELARKFRQLCGGFAAPVLVISAYNEQKNRQDSFEAGALEFLSKPFEGAELSARVQSLLSFRWLMAEQNEKEKFVALGEIMAEISHQLRNPANAVINGLPLLSSLIPEEELEKSENNALLQCISSAATKISQICHDILNSMRTNTMWCRKEKLDDLVRDAVLMVPALKQVELKLALAPVETIFCAGPMVTQALMSLLDNAAYAAAGGWVKVEAHQEGERVLIEIADSGPGVPPDLRDRIFEPLFTTKPVGEGTGIGLVTARRVAQEHGGSLILEERDGKTIFRMELPLTSVSNTIRLADLRTTPLSPPPSSDSGPEQTGSGSGSGSEFDPESELTPAVEDPFSLPN